MNLKVCNASFAYQPAEPILQDVNFEAQSGELIAVLGPNGAGKTTLLRCLLGTLKWKSGVCTVDGQDIRTIGTKKLWQKLAYVPQARGTAIVMKQNPDGTLSGLTLEEAREVQNSLGALL